MRCWFANANAPYGREHLSEHTKAAVDQAVRTILEEQRRRAVDILTKHKSVIEWLADALQEHKVIEAKTLGELLKKSHPAAAKKLNAKEPNEAQESE